MPRQSPAAEPGSSEEEGGGGRFQRSLGLHHTGSLAHVCCRFATYDTKTCAIWVRETKLGNGINEVNEI